MQAPDPAGAHAPSHCAYSGDWGPWLLDPKAQILWVPDRGLTFMLGDCDRSAKVLDRIFQIRGHDYGDQLIPGLLGALFDILCPQANLCSWGEDKRLTKAAIRRMVTRAADCPGNRACGRIH